MQYLGDLLNGKTHYLKDYLGYNMTVNTTHLSPTPLLAALILSARKSRVPPLRGRGAPCRLFCLKDKEDKEEGGGLLQTNWCK